MIRHRAVYAKRPRPGRADVVHLARGDDTVTLCGRQAGKESTTIIGSGGRICGICRSSLMATVSRADRAAGPVPR